MILLPPFSRQQYPMPQHRELVQMRDFKNRHYRAPGLQRVWSWLTRTFPRV